MEIRNEIREFLASRQAHITPQQAGLPAYGGHRRVPGLRREEVALLAGVSVDYYTQMERGHLGGSPTASWKPSPGRCSRIGTATELEIASRRPDDTLRNPRTIWVVRVGDDLYVRSMYGRAGGWFPGTQVRHQGHIRAGGVDKDVTSPTPTPTSTTPSTPPTATSTAATANASSAAS